MSPDTDPRLGVLACPRTDTALTLTDDLWHSAAGAVDYPSFNGVPWLFAEPGIAMAEWQQRFRHADSVLAGDIRQLENALAAPPPSAVTRQRIAQLLSGKQLQRSVVRDLLAPLETVSTADARPGFLALRTRLPPDQGLNTYTPNIVRDWAEWGKKENVGSLEIVTEALGPVAPRRVLVLGAGAGRLTHDLNVALQPDLTVGLDFNPLLMLLAARLSGGETQAFVEFPLAPKSLPDHAVTHTLQAPTQPTRPTQWVLGDALRPPFVEGAFDLVVTPWLLDIISERPAAFAPRVNRLLAAGGSWVTFGSVAFRDPDPMACIGIEELAEQIETAGFSAGAAVERTLPYLDSPSSRHGRVEQLAALRFDKTATVTPKERWRALPDWIVVGKSPVPATDAFLQQAAATRIHAFIMALIDGRRSLREMAAIMEQKQLMPAADAEDAIRGFLIKMFDDARRYSGF